MLDNIQLMGWSYLPSKLTVTPADGDSTILNENQYFYIKETQILTLLYEFDMNQGYTIRFE